jgi:hypothetical protein
MVIKFTDWGWVLRTQGFIFRLLDFENMCSAKLCLRSP